ncbi:hypothetical protein, partial [Methylobacterium sp. 174MFSha1.1]
RDDAFGEQGAKEHGQGQSRMRDPWDQDTPPRHRAAQRVGMLGAWFSQGTLVRTPWWPAVVLVAIP